ncbi:MAG: FG-GAP-like repeat-containing protein [Euryarchaeota archaeon]|nr:FG-GAP-like repeat-containing protein [Euryarchaeota archaeon]
MNDKMNSIVFMVVVLLSILVMVAAPVMAENATDMEETRYRKPMCDEKEDLTCKVTGLGTESFSATLESASLSSAITAFAPDTIINISEESAPIENFINMSTITPHSCWCDLRWSGDGVWSSKSTYSKTEEFVCYVQFKNYLQDCSYIIDFQLYHPPEESIKYDFEDGAIKYDTVQKYTYRYPAPGTGWDPGGYKFCSKVEPRVCDGRVLEKCCTFTVLPEPDLVITDIYSDGNTIYYKIKNEGDETAGASNTSLTADGVFLTSDSVFSLEPGAKRTKSFNCIWNCTNTDDTVKVCADYMGDVAESSESNNCRTKTLMCNPPDIWISPVSFDVELSPDVVSDHTLTIGNNGTGALDFVIDDVETQAISARATSLDMVFNNAIIHSTDVFSTQYGHDTADNAKDSSNFSEGERTASTNITSVDGTGIMGWGISSIPSQPGWPKRTGGWVMSSPALGDIDGDGDLEVVVGSWDKKVYAWHHDGSTVDGWPKITGTTKSHRVGCSPALGDLDGDGYMEVVIGSHYLMYAWHHDGTNVSGWPIEWPRVTGSLGDPALGDMDGDGDLEIVVGSRWRGVSAWHHDGSNVSGWPKTTGAGCACPAIGDIDGDRDVEVVVGSWDDKVYAWHHDGSTVDGWPKTTEGSVASPALGDIDGDGDIEIVVGSLDCNVHAWHHDGTIVDGWPIATGGYYVRSPALGDIDGDGDLEIVVGSHATKVSLHGNKVHAWHHDGTIVSGWPKKTGHWVRSSPALGDIDGDGDIEVVIGSLDNKVYAWHHDGATVDGWPKTTGDDVSSSPALGDIDGDGDIEVVIGSYDDRVYAWDCSGTYNQSNIEWGTFHHDARRTGLHGAIPSDREGWLSESPTSGTVDPGSQTGITLTFNTAGLPFGEYHANITINSNDPDENPVIIPVRLTVTSSRKGDLDYDNQITPADAAIALHLAATGAHDDAADVSGDDRVTSLDVLMILQAAAGNIEL